MNRIIAFLFILFSTASLQAQQDTLVLSLPEALQIAQTQSPDALIAKHRFRRSYWEYRSYKALYLPQVNLSAVLPNISGKYRTIPVLEGPDVFRYNTISNAQLQLDVDQRIGFTGGSVFLKTSLQRLDNYYGDSTLTTYQSIPVLVGYNQPIFQYNSYKWDKKIEPLKYEKAKRKYMEDVEQINILTTNHFFNLLLAQIETNIAIKNMYNYDTLFKIAKGRFNLGKIAENELLQLELNYLRAKSSVDLASLNYKNMLFQLKSYLRLKEDIIFDLIPPTETRHEELSAGKAIIEAKKNTSTSLDFEERILSVEAMLNKSKMDGRFDANLYLEYGLTQSAYTVSDAYKSPRNQQVVNLGINVPLVDWGVARGGIKMAQSSMELEETAVEQDLIDFEQSVFLEIMQFNMQKDQLTIAAKSDTVAQKRFDITQKRYMIGQVNDVLELNNAQIDNDNAKKSYYQSLRSYWNNYYQIRKITLYDFFDNRMLILDVRDVL